MTELERVPIEGEVIEDKPEWEVLVSEWAEGARQEFVGQLRQARVAAAVSRHYGRSSMEAFAREIGASKSKVYDYCRVWQTYGHLFEEGQVSGRPESPLGISHYIEASYAPDPQKMIEEAEDEDLTTRQIEERRKEPQGVEAQAEKVQETPCPSCGAPSSAWERPPVGVSNG